MPSSRATSTIGMQEIFRAGLLNGVSVLFAGVSPGDPPPQVPGPSAAGARASVSFAAPPEGDSLGASVQSACAALGARVSIVAPVGAPSPDAPRTAVHDAGAETAHDAAAETAMDERVAVALAGLGGLDLLVVDAGSMFLAGAAHGGDGGRSDARSPLRACLQGAWNLTRAVVTVALLPAGRGGRILYLAPAAAAGEHARAARAGLENLARTLSIEWARHGITALTVAPADGTSAEELAAIVAYLGSPAGAYFSGCLLDLTGPGAG
jgi:NAD(P)-dependent dehydrogenase (short-subunit alcohol dehydrogenase family)